MENNRQEHKQDDHSFEIVEQLFFYLRFWPYFLVSVLFCFLVSKYYLNHSVSVFETKAKVKIIDDSKNNFVLPNSPVALFSKNKVNLENEIEVIKSYRLLEQVCKNLNLNTQYFNVGYLNNIEIWKNRPFSIAWLDNSVTMDRKSISFEIEIVKNGYKLVASDLKTDVVLPFNTVQHINGIPYTLTLQVGEKLAPLLGTKYLISHQPLSSSILSLSGGLSIVNSNKNSDILIISLSNANKDKSESILNEIIRQFEVDGLNDKRLVYNRTIEFVNERFKSLENELDSIETNKASFKRNNELTFITADAQTATLRKISATDDVFQIETQIALAKVLEQTIIADKKLNLLPANIGLSNNGVNQLIVDYNTVVLERDKNLVSAAENNPRTQFFNSKLVDLKANILQSVKSYQQELEVALSKNNFIRKSSSDKFSAIPINEKILRGIERQQNLKETLYLLLLQKREEAAINLAITSSSMKVIDYALTNGNPISPKRGTFYLISILIGLLIPFLIIYINQLLDNKLHTKEDVLKIIKDKIILSEVPHIETNLKLTSVNDRSILGESFRILRTNMSYIFPLQNNKIGQTIMVTSTIKGEGKTFTSLNLAISFSIMNKKVLVIGADMRNPQLHNYISISKNENGLQDYLHDYSTDWHSIVKKNCITNNPSLDIILSGAIPPNPAELLSNGRLGKLLEEAKKEYDFVILDTPPTLLVTDTLIISPLVDTTLYVVRADFTPKNLLDFSVTLSDRGKLINMAYVINNVGNNYKVYSYKYGYNYSYNYGYGYGYEMDGVIKKTFIKRLFSVFFKK